MGIFDKLFSRKSQINVSSNYFSTHKIGGLYIDVEGIINNVNVNFESYAEVSYLKNFIINKGEANLPQFDDYVVVLSKVGVINNDQLVLSTRKDKLPTLYYDLRDAKDYVTHSLLGDRFINENLISSPLYVYDGRQLLL